MKWWQILRGWQRHTPAFAAWSHADGLPMTDAGQSTEDAELAAAVPQHIPAMLRAATALVGRAAAEDATQEAILRAWQALGTLRNRAALRAWLLRITVNVCREWRRDVYDRQARLLEPLPDDDHAILATLADDPGANQHAAALDLRAAINALDDDQRLIVVLRYYAEMDATEVGQALGIPAATVRTRLRRALISLRARLSDANTHTTLTEQEGGSHGTREA